MKNLLILVASLLFAGSLFASKVDELYPPHNLAVSANTNEANVNLTWTMPVEGEGLASFADDFEKIEDFDDPFKEEWEVTHNDINEGIYWVRGYHQNAYDTIWTNGLAKVEYGWNAETNLITPAIAVEEATKISFRWTSYYDTHNFFQVNVSIDDGTTWEKVWDWDEANFFEVIGMPEMQTTINLSEYAGYNVKVSFNYKQLSGGSIIYMDDVAIGASKLNEGTINLSDKSIVFADMQNSTVTRAKGDLTGFKVFRDETLIHEINDPATRAYTDLAVEDGTHTYKMTAVYGDEESIASNSDQVTINTVDYWMYYGSGSEYYYGFSRNEYGSYKVAVDFELPAEYSWEAKKVVTANYAELEANWQVVAFNETPSEQTIGTLEGTINTVPATFDGQNLYFYDVEKSIDDRTELNGHIAVVLEIPTIEPSTTDRNNINFQKMDFYGNPNGQHTWYKAHADSSWMILDYLQIGAWNLKLQVSKTGEGITEVLPGSTELFQNYPNPFNPNTNISFFNTMSGNVNLSVYNTKGELVANLLNKQMETGHQSVDFNASNLNSGVYYYTLKTGAKTITKKMVLVK